MITHNCTGSPCSICNSTTQISNNSSYTNTNCVKCGLLTDGSIGQYYYNNLSYCHNCFVQVSAQSTYVTGINSTTTYPYFNYPDIEWCRTNINDLINLETTYNEIKATCSRCKEEKNIKVKYNILKIERKLCESCTLEVIDSLFGINKNSKMESLLYGK